MQRYTVTIVSPGDTPDQLRPVLAVPFEPSALVSAFIEELFRRIARQGLKLEPSTHLAALHLDSETGAIIDSEDALKNVITDPKTEKLYAVFQNKPNSMVTDDEAATTAESAPAAPQVPTDDQLALRIVTPELAKNDFSALPVIHISKTATISQLHDAVADHLQLPHNFETSELDGECNCTLAKRLADGTVSPSHVFVIHGKSQVTKLELAGSAATQVNLDTLLLSTFGENILTNKKVTNYGEVRALSEGVVVYKKPPVVAICAKSRHVPAHARQGFDENSTLISRRVLDLHTSELPISRAAPDSTIAEAGLEGLAVYGAITIYAVKRAFNNSTFAGSGKSAIFRHSACWEPAVKQSDRGVAMFLSSLRVFTSIVQDMGDNERMKDAVYHCVDLLCRFPPALRTLHILASGQTPSSVECAAISGALFEVMDSFVPTEIIGSGRNRVFEGSRLLFGFMLEKARSLKMADDAVDVHSLPYLSSFETVDLRDHKSNEAVLHAVRTSTGLVEKSLFEALQGRGVLVDSNVQTYLDRIEDVPRISRVALMSGGVVPEATVFSTLKLAGNYLYPDQGVAASAFDATELRELHHVAELCGRNKLTVYMPCKLVSAVAPCLTFDRLGHLAVYTGQLPCSAPGQSSEIFRPKHGQETINETVLEQILAPIVKVHEADGTAVFDILGGSAAVKRLQNPDEILIVAVDVSASMRLASDFAELNESEDHLSDNTVLTADSVVDPEHYTKATFDDMKELLSSHETFNDMTAIVAEAAFLRPRDVATRVLEVLRSSLSSQVLKKHSDLEARQQRRYPFSAQLTELRSSVDKLKTFFAGIRTHEDGLVDFLLYRATTSPAVTRAWKWQLGSGVPASASPRNLPSIPSHLTELPDALMCPISHGVMEEAVKAADNHTYSRQSIEQWFAVGRISSPMHGLELENTNLTANDTISNKVAAWIQGKGIIRTTSSPLKLTFVSRVGKCERMVHRSMSMNDLYKLAFRANKARFEHFQLARSNGDALAPSLTTIEAAGIRSGDEITVRLADEADIGVSSTGNSTAQISTEMCLIKVYDDCDRFAFAYWAQKDTTCTLESVMMKYWRHKFSTNPAPTIKQRQVWSDLTTSGDGLMSGHPRDSDEKLAGLLNIEHCFGKLEEEPVFSEPRFAFDRFDSDLAAEPLVLKLHMGNVWKTQNAKEKCKFTRLDVLKQMFEALVNRIIAYNFNTHVGLISFGETATVAQPISHVIENFRRAVSQLKAEGNTALWEALQLARDQLQQYAAGYPNAKKRVIVISDGANTKTSAVQAHDVAFTMMQDNVVVDSITLGEEDFSELRAVSHSLGSYKFHPESLENALQICELEPFLSLSERPPIALPSGISRNNTMAHMANFFRAQMTARTTTVNSHTFPPRKAHPNINDSFVELSQAHARRPAGTTQGGTRSNLRTTRILNEINRVVSTSADRAYDVYVSESDMSFFKVVVRGPPDSPYSEGTFLLYLHMGDTFPTFAPEARFVTKIRHPNVNAHGRICHALLSRDWTSDVSLTTVLDTIYGLLLQAETSDPVNTTATLGYHHDQVEYNEEVREFTERHASKTAAQWRQELLGEAEAEAEDEDEDEQMHDDEDDDYDEDYEDEEMTDVDEDEDEEL